MSSSNIIVFLNFHLPEDILKQGFIEDTNTGKRLKLGDYLCECDRSSDHQCTLKKVAKEANTPAYMDLYGTFGPSRLTWRQVLNRHLEEPCEEDVEFMIELDGGEMVDMDDKILPFFIKHVRANGHHQVFNIYKIGKKQVKGCSPSTEDTSNNEPPSRPDVALDDSDSTITISPFGSPEVSSDYEFVDNEDDNSTDMSLTPERMDEDEE